jgi:arylsulfate sulfotransferase
MEVTLTPTYEGPGAVGNLMTWVATVSDSPSGTLWYRFRSRAPYGRFKLVRDFGPNPVIDFAPTDHEGVYEMEVTVRNLDTGEFAASVGAFEFLPRVINEPLANATAHPLVFLFSAPPCREGASMIVQFQTGVEPATLTSPKRCDGARTMNFLLGGLRGGTAYRAHSIVFSRLGQIRGPEVAFETEALLDFHKPPRVLTPGAVPKVNGVLLTSDGMATDLAGNLIWANPNPLSNITRADAGGYFWGYIEEPNVDISYQIIRKVDLLGQTVLETNAARVNEQLTALGKRNITAFHHEVRPIGGGRVMALATNEQLLSDVQGPGAVNILGDMIIVLDEEMNVIWTWDALDHLDISRPAILGETCTPTAGGCPPFYLTPTANDWTHSNALQLTPDGHLLISVRHLDWLLKVDFADGEGDGHIIWRLGKDGDFRLDDPDPNVWFSHQHDGNFEVADPTRLVVFDNGNTRVAQTGRANSRGQVWKLDETNMTAKPVLNADLGVYALAVGSAQALPNGNYHFHAGYVFGGPTPAAYTFEVNRVGSTVYSLQADRLIYRTFRLPDLYSPE